MLTMPAPVPLRGELLADQLAAAGLSTPVVLVGDLIEMIGLDESDRAAAQTVLDAHPATAQAALDAAQTERTNAATIRDRALAAMETDRAFLDITGTPTNAQILAQVRALTRHDIGELRLLLNRFDGTD